MTVVNAKMFTFPELLDAAETHSAKQQKVFYASVGAQSSLLAVAAVASLAPANELGDIGPILSLVLFVGVIAIQVAGVTDRAERSWYEARAASETIKTAAWEFATGGEAFRVEDGTSANRFRQLVRDVLDQLHRIDVPSATHTNAGVTESMEALRGAPIVGRRSVYSENRICDQLDWYRRKSKSNKKNALVGRVVIVLISAIAILFGVLRVHGDLEANWLSVLATMASGVAVWVQAKKYTQLSEAYSVTSHEISILASTIDEERTEEQWSQFVHDAEAAFSREHTMWTARRQGPI